VGNIMKRALLCWVIVGALTVAILPGIGCGRKPAQAPAQAPPAEQAPEAEVWTCPMHPQVRESKAGRCPICGMDLVRATKPAGAKP
jgi:Cu(I)/Ag(I) efflux system membrane fusion protein